MAVRLRRVLYNFAHLLPSEDGRDVHLPGDHPISPTEIRRICMALLRHQILTTLSRNIQCEIVY